MKHATAPVIFRLSTMALQFMEAEAARRNALSQCCTSCKLAAKDIRV